MAEIQDPGNLFDILVQSSLERCAAAKTTAAFTMPGCKALTVVAKRQPVQDDTPREIGMIDPKLREVFRELVSGKRPWPLFLTGQAGRGKSAAALCLADHVPGSVYFRFPRLLKSFLWATKEGGVLLSKIVDDFEGKPKRESWTANEHQFFKYLVAAPLLVVDDIATRSGYTDAQYDNFFELVDDRKFRPTVIVSNLALAEIGEVFDDRIVSRIARGTLFTLGGPDRRRPT